MNWAVVSMNDDKLLEWSWGESDVEPEHRMSSWCRTVIPSNQHYIPSPDRLLKKNRALYATSRRGWD